MGEDRGTGWQTTMTAIDDKSEQLPATSKEARPQVPQAAAYRSGSLIPVIAIRFFGIHQCTVAESRNAWSPGKPG
jgi:hypothetical protein